MSDDVIHRSTDEIARRLREALPEGAGITKVVQLPGGHSNETYIVEGIDQVLRMPPAGAVLLGSAFAIAGQHAILSEVGTRPGPPVPRITHFDPDGAMLGAPCFLMERLPGKPWSDWNAPDWALGRPESFLARISEQVVDALAVLHAQPPLEAFGPVRSSAAELGRWRDSVAGIALPDPAGRLFEELIESTPPLDDPAPVHGDTKFPNMLWEEGVLVAVLDWELGFNGDPRWDITYTMMPFASDQHPSFPGFDTPGLWQAARLAAEWSRRSSRRLDRLHWFEAANWMKICAVHAYGAALFASGATDDTRFKAFADYVQPCIDYAAALHELDRAGARHAAEALL